MERKEFIKLGCALCGATAVAAFVASCSKSSTSSTPQGPTVNFTLDLSKSANASLNNNGGYVYSNGVIVARVSATKIIAVASSCTHAGCTVAYTNGSQTFDCPCHGGQFDTGGGVKSGPPPAPLKSYSVTQSGNILTIQG